MLSRSERHTAIHRSVGVVMEMLEMRVLLSTTVPTSELPNPNVPISPLPEAPLPLQGVVGTPLSLSPSMIDTAYGFNDIGYDVNGVDVLGNGAGTTIAIVDPYGSPTIVNDLETFDAHWGISNNDGEGNFCLTIQPLGGANATPGPVVTTNPDAAAETSLDVEWAHAVAPGAHILLVEAPDTTMLHLMDSVVYAAEQPGVVAVSMSWGYAIGSPNLLDEPYLYDGFMTTPAGHLDSSGIPGGVTFLASSGDSGVLQYPAASINVLSVGGETQPFGLNGELQDGSIGWNNTYGSSGGGSDTIYANPFNTPFVALAADPEDGVWIYDSTPDDGVTGWQVVGGTSFSCPAWAGFVSILDQGMIDDGNGSLDSNTMIDELINAGETSPDYFFTDYGATVPNYPLSTEPAPSLKAYQAIPSLGNTGFGAPNSLALAGLMINTFFGSISTSLITPQSVDDLAFVQGPTDTTAGQTISPSITVDETGGNSPTLVGAVTISISVLSPSGTPTLLGTTTEDASGGVATFSDLSIDQAGTYELQVSQPGVLSATSSQFVVSAAAPAQLGFTAQPGATWQFGPVTPAVAVGMEDTFGNVVETSTNAVTISIESGPTGGAISGGTTVSAVAGSASFSDLVFSQAGDYTLLATSPGLTSAVSDSFTVVGIPSTRRFLFNGAALGAVLLLQQEHRNASIVASQGPPTSEDVDAVAAQVSAPAAASVPAPSDVTAGSFAADTGASDSLGPSFSFVPVASTLGDSDSQGDDQLNDLLAGN